MKDIQFLGFEFFVWSLHDFYEIIYDPCMTTKNSYKSYMTLYKY